jgi:hypothetical protein
MLFAGEDDGAFSYQIVCAVSRLRECLGQAGMGFVSYFSFFISIFQTRHPYCSLRKTALHPFFRASAESL